MNFLQVTGITISACVFTWTVSSCNKSIIKFVITLIEDAEKINKKLASPNAIKTWHLTFNFVIIVGLLLMDAYYFFMNHELDSYSSGALIIAISTMLYLQTKRNQANK